MRYAILKDGYPHYAPSSILLGDRRIFNPTPEQLREASYLPVVTSEPPQTDEQHYPESSWVEQEDQIVQIWTVKEIPVEPEGPTLESVNAKVDSVQSDVAALSIIITGKEVSHHGNQ